MGQKFAVGSEKVSPGAMAAHFGDAVGSANVVLDPQVKSSYEHDWTGRFSGRSALVVRPANAQEVAEVIRLCHSLGLGVVPQGGNTGLVGGGVPRDGEVVISLKRLRELEYVDEVSRQVTVGAGVTLAELQRHAESSGLAFGVDHAARDSATIGGMVATNAGGRQVLRYGPTRAQVTGLEAVLPNGTIVSRLLGLEKDNVGYDWPGLVIGSEGTLAIVTRARLRLHPRLPKRVAALIAIGSTEVAVSLVSLIRKQVPCLEAADIFWQDGLDRVCSRFGKQSPFAHRHPCYLLLEFADIDDPTDKAWRAIKRGPGVLDTVVAQDTGGREALWFYREAHTEAMAESGVPLKMDVSLPLSKLAAFESEVRSVVEQNAKGASVVLYGHIGDGNLHVNVVGADPSDDHVDEVVFKLVSAQGGSISAEHGVGILKSRWLEYTRTQNEIELMRALKRALDPESMLNPGVIFPSVS